MELQHLQVALISRINTHAGEKLVTRLRFTQDHVAAPLMQPHVGRTVERVPVEGLSGPLAEALSDLLQSIRERG